MHPIDIEAALAELTLAEKAALTAGKDFWHTKAISRLGIPSLRTSDGPNGVRGTQFFHGISAACFPCATALGSTFDADLLYEVGALLAQECRIKGVHALLAPTINIQRSPLGGRGFESFSEDPFLSGILAGQYINGLQKHGVMATIKHFVCNDQEHDRMGVDSVVTQRALREIYLMPFMLAIKFGNPASVMTSYNKVNGVHVAENKFLIDILRKEWKWNGLVMSDWFGTYSTSEGINAGQDLEMPGPTKWRGEILEHAVISHKVKPQVLDERVRAVLEAINIAAKSGIPENAKEEELNRSQDRQFLRRVAAESVVLLKNEDSILPFDASREIAVIGPNARFATYAAGGSANLDPYYAITTYEGLLCQCEKTKFAFGAQANKFLCPLGPEFKVPDGGRKPGFRFQVFDQPVEVPDRQPLDAFDLTNSELLMFDYKIPDYTSEIFYVKLSATLVPEETGWYDFGLVVQGYGQLFINDEVLVDNTRDQKPGTAFFGLGTAEERGSIKLEKHKTYEFRTEFASPATQLGVGKGGLRVGCELRRDWQRDIAEAGQLASEIEQTVVCVGLNSDWETESFDRPDMEIPGTHTEELIRRVLEVNPNAVIVINSGTPVAMPWVDEARCIVQAWYGGNEAGNGLADVLLGKVNPAGKLSISFPRRLSDNPSYLNWGSQRGRVLYGEDVYVGYRYYDTVSRPALFPFGHGLSYTTFEMSNLCIVVSPDKKTSLTVTVSVKNTGPRHGAEVVQVYVSARNPSIKRPTKELKGFRKVKLDAGEVMESVEVIIDLKYASSFWDEDRDAWIMEKGKYGVLVGNSSQPAVATVAAAGGGNFLEAEYEIEETSWWSGL